MVLKQAQVHTLRELAAKARQSAEIPARLQFRLHYFTEHDSTDEGAQGAGDEVWLSAQGLDSAAVVVGADGKPDTSEVISTPPLGDISPDGGVREQWREKPHVLLEFDLRRPSDWPRSFSVVLMLIEEDSGDLNEDFKKLEAEFGDELKKKVEAAASEAAAAVVGATIGTAIPGIGVVVGQAVGALAGDAYEGIVEAISDGLANEVFPFIELRVEFAGPSDVRNHASIGKVLHHVVKEHGAHYTIDYDWFLVD